MEVTSPRTLKRESRLGNDDNNIKVLWLRLFISIYEIGAHLPKSPWVRGFPCLIAALEGPFGVDWPCLTSNLFVNLAHILQVFGRFTVCFSLYVRWLKSVSIGLIAQQSWHIQFGHLILPHQLDCKSKRLWVYRLVVYRL